MPGRGSHLQVHHHDKPSHTASHMPCGVGGTQAKLPCCLMISARLFQPKISPPAECCKVGVSHGSHA